MDSTESLSHSKWECKYRVIFIPKCRRKVIYEKLRPHLGEVFRKLAEQKESRILEGHLMSEPRAHADLDSAKVCGVAGNRVHQGEERDSLGQGVWRAEAKFRGAAFLGAGILDIDGGRNEAVVRDYIRNQEKGDQRLEQMLPW